MAQAEMFAAKANSPATELTAAITDVQTTVSVLDASKLPDAPNLATIGGGESAETVHYTWKSENMLMGVTRGFSGTVAKAWAAGVQVARYFTAYDADALRGNVTEHSAELLSISEQLAEKAEQAALATTNNIISTKADISYVDAKVQSAASGAPRAAYATLADLQAAHPTGDSSVYLVTTNGHIYKWDGASWVDTGIQYQSTGIAPNSVTSSMIAAIDYGKVTNSGTSQTLQNELDFLKGNFEYMKDVTFNTGETFAPRNRSTLKVVSISNDSTTVGVPAAIYPVIAQTAISNIMTLPSLLQGESIDVTHINRAWAKYTLKGLTFTYFGMENSGTYYRLKANVPDSTNLSTATSVVNLLSTNSAFPATSQVNSSAAANSIYILSTDKSINLKVSKAEFDASGLGTIEAYVNSLADFVFYARLVTKVQEAHKITYNAFAGSEVTFTPSTAPAVWQWYAEDYETTDVNYTRHEVEIKNPLPSVAYANDLIQIYMSFGRGDCKGENYISVSDSAGAIYPHQWDDARSVSFKYDKNVGRYNDGSLKDGTIWIKDSLAAGASKKYYVDVFDNEQNGYTAGVSSVYASDVLTLSTADVALKFEKARKMTLSNVAYKGSNKYGSSTDVATLRYKDSLSTVRTAFTNGQLVEYQVTGSGVLFREFTGVWTIDNKFEFTQKIRLFANNEVTFQYFAEAMTALATTDAYGTAMQVAYPITATRNFYDFGALPSKMTCIDWTEDTKKMLAIPYYAHGDTPRDDNTRPTYPSTVVVAISSDRAVVSTGWEYASGNTLYPIEQGEVFSGKIVLDIGGYADTTDNDTNRVFNQLCGRATNEPIILNEISLLDRLVDWSQHVDYNYVESYSPSRLFYPYMSKYILYRFKGIGDFYSLIGYYKQTIINYFGGGTEAGLIEAYNTTTSAGYNLSSRIIPMAVHYREECIKLGDTANQTYMETLLKAYAELSCQLVEAHGFTPLNYTTTEANSNACASGLKALSIGLDLEPSNTRWLAAYNTNLAYFMTLLSATNIIQENAATKLARGHYLHYSAYAMFDYLLSTHHTNAISPQAYMWEATAPTGAMREQEYCMSASRRGLGHTNAYVLYGLVKERTPYSIAQASRVLDNLVSQGLPNGGHKFPLENWRLETASNYSSSVPFELHAYGETILLINSRV